MKIGDKVNFLSSTGGGTIAGFKGKDIVLVEDADGFQIPTSIHDVVLVGSSNDYSTTKVVSAKMKQGGESVAESKSIKAMMAEGLDEEETVSPADELVDINREVTFKAPVEERKGGNQLSCYLAFVPLTPKEMTTTRFEVYVVNDSTYYIHFLYTTAENTAWTLHADGEVEPNTQLFLEEIGREDLNNMLKIGFQLTAYKRDKSFLMKPVVDVQFRLDPVKFYKLHTFRDTPFFHHPALLYTLVENDVVARSISQDVQTLKQQFAKRADQAEAQAPAQADGNDYQRRYDNGKKGNPFAAKHASQEVVVDLHANALLDTTAGMSHADILHYQLDKFKETMEAYKSKKGQKIVFIHGKGDGILRQALIKALNYQYKRCTYQDASFQEYGYGATQVTIK